MRLTLTGVVLAALLAACGSHDDSRPEAGFTSGTNPVRSFTHVVRDDGCNRRVAPIRLKPLPPQTEPPIGPPPLRVQLHHGRPPATRGYPVFPRRLGGLPYRGYSRRRGSATEGVVYARGRVENRAYDGVLSRGALLVSAARYKPNRQRFLSGLRGSLTRVRIEQAPGWISQMRDDTPTGVLFRTVIWLPRGRILALSGDLSARRLMKLARSLVC